MNKIEIICGAALGLFSTIAVEFYFEMGEVYI